MRQGRTLYRREAGVEPNNLQRTELGYIKPLWRNQPSSEIPLGLPFTPSIEDSDFMGFDATETYLIPACSQRPAQQPPAIKAKIRPAVVEKSAIKFLGSPAL